MMVYCEDCDGMHPSTAKEPPWRARCSRAPIAFKGYGFVSRDYAPAPPFELCSRVNPTGECEMFSPARAKSTLKDDLRRSVEALREEQS
jgi:hypothetical protein